MKTTVITVDGANYQFAKMAAKTGSYVWQRLLAGVFKAAQGAAPQQDAPEGAVQPSVDARMRGLCAVAFMNMEEKDYLYVQTLALRTVTLLQTGPGGEQLPMPVATFDGALALPEADDNPFLVTKLVTEALVYNLSCFLAGTGA